MTMVQLATPIPRDKAVSSIATDVLLTIVTCGIYNLFWQARQFRVLNAFLGRQEFRFGMWLLLTLITCGLYHIYTEFQMAKSVLAIQRRLGKPTTENLPLISLIVSLLGLTIVADAINRVSSMGSSNRNGDTLVLARLGLAAFAVVALGNLLGLWHTSVLVAALPDLCPIHRWTGYDCPGCGMGRSLAQLTQGHIAAAFHQHPFGPLVALWCGAWAVLPARVWRRLPHTWLMASDAPAITLVASLLIWWVFAKVV